MTLRSSRCTPFLRCLRHWRHCARDRAAPSQRGPVVQRPTKIRVEIPRRHPSNPPSTRTPHRRDPQGRIRLPHPLPHDQRKKRAFLGRNHPLHPSLGILLSIRQSYATPSRLPCAMLAAVAQLVTTSNTKKGAPDTIDKLLAIFKYENCCKEMSYTIHFICIPNVGAGFATVPTSL